MVSDTRQPNIRMVPEPADPDASHARILAYVYLRAKRYQGSEKGMCHEMMTKMIGYAGPGGMRFP